MRKRLLILVMSLMILYSCNQKTSNYPVYQKITGITMGVISYNIIYADTKDQQIQIGVDSLLNGLNNSLSTYVSDSEISELNDSGNLKYRSGFFLPMLKTSKEVYQITSGAFDPTVGPLVNLWGFGPGKDIEIPDSSRVKEALAKVGFNKVMFNDQGAQAVPGTSLDFSAIAKGYAVDEVAKFLESKSISNYFVEIGGEVVCHGVNKEKQLWKTGIYDPRINDSPTHQVAAIVNVKDMAIATSGNYRNFYIRDGKKYAHTISPFTGFPVQHSLLSASVFSKSCTTADAYATAFMVLGIDKSIRLVEANSELEAHLIYADENGQLLTYTSEGIKDAIILE